MKKKIFVILISIVVIISSVNATCDDNERNRLKSLSKDITYETSYSISTKTFTIKFYNVFPGLIIGINDGRENGQDFSFQVDKRQDGQKVHLTLELTQCLPVKGFLFNITEGEESQTYGDSLLYQRL